MVNRLERAYLKRFFIFISSNYNIRKLKLIHLVLIWYETKGLQIAKIWNFGKTETPWGFRMVQKWFLDSASSFLLQLIKTSNIITFKYAPNYFESTFGWTNFLPKNSKLKLVFKEAEKEPRKASFPWDLGLLWGQPIWSN